MKLVLDNGKEVELSKELEEQLEKVIEDNTKENSYREPKYMETYYYISLQNRVAANIWKDSLLDKELYKNFNCFLDEKSASKRAFKQLLERKLEILSHTYDGDEIDWGDEVERKWSIYYDYSDNELYIGEDHDCRSQGVTYFYREKTANKALEAFREDLIKYFTM